MNARIRVVALAGLILLGTHACGTGPDDAGAQAGVESPSESADGETTSSTSTLAPTTTTTNTTSSTTTAAPSTTTTTSSTTTAAPSTTTTTSSTTTAAPTTTTTTAPTTTTTTAAPTTTTAAPTTTTAAAPPADGAAIYAQRCSSCHGADGSGSRGPSLIGVPATAGRAAIHDQVTNGSGGMPAFGNRLSAAEIDAVVDYVMGAF